MTAERCGSFLTHRVEWADGEKALVCAPHAAIYERIARQIGRPLAVLRLSDPLLSIANPPMPPPPSPPALPRASVPLLPAAPAAPAEPPAAPKEKRRKKKRVRSA